jgi:hypothetical protein
VAGLVILASFAAYRLSEGHPYHLAFLVPYIQRSLDPPNADFHVKLDDLIIAWTGGERLIGLRAVHVRAVTRDGRVLASVPQIGISLSLRAMLRGMLAPTRIDVFNPHIHMRRSKDGRFLFLTAPGDGLAGQPSRFVPEFLEGLMGPPRLDRMGGYLRRAHLIDGTLDFDDQRTGVVWHAPKIDIELMRDRQGIIGRFSSQIAELGNPALLDADFAYDAGAGQIGMNGRFSGLEIAALGLIAPDLTSISGSHFQFSGSVNTQISVDGTLSAVHFSLAGGPGTIDLPSRFTTPVPVSSIAIAGQLDSGFDSVSLQEFALDLGGPLLRAHAHLSGLTSYHVGKIGRLRVTGEAAASDVPVRRLPNLWPLSAGGAGNAREWVVTNIDDGTVEKVEVKFDVAFAGGDLDTPQVLAFGGKLKASGVGLNYFRPLPPIRGAAGEASFDATKFTADFTSGNVEKLLIRGGHLAITGLDKVDQIIAIEGDVEGPLRDALELLDHPRLGYMRKMGLNPADSGGSFATHLTFRLPASKHVRFEQIQLTAHAKIAQAELGGVFMHRNLSEGNFELELDGKGMLAQGRAKLARIPASLRWESHFDAVSFRNRITVDAQTNADDLARLGFDYRDVITGPLAVELVYTEPRSRPNELTVDFDLIEASAAIDFAKWKKPPGVAANAKLRMTLEGDNPIAITAFRFKSGGFFGNGQGRFDAKGHLVQVSFQNLALGATRLQDVSVDFVGERADIHIAGGEFDAQPYLGYAAPTTRAAAPSEDEKPTRPYSLTAEHLERVIVGPNREIEKVRLVAVYDGLHWQRLEADGTSPGGRPMTLRWLPSATGTFKLSLVAEDAGAALKVLGIVDNVIGGRLAITGSASASDPKRAITGHAEVSEYRLIKQSALVRLLTIATLTGIADALTGEGFQMYGFEGDFIKTNGRIDVPLARTWGPSLGLTATGFIDYDANQIDLKGTVVPAYALNSLIGQIPIVGYLLSGGKGTGMFAAIYSATGKLSEPTISVNPLSALAPGFLRGVFGLFSDGKQGPSTALPPNSGGKGISK